MEREKKDLSFILILLSTLIGTAVLFQWAIVTGLYAPLRNPAMWERLMEKDILFRFLYVILIGGLAFLFPVGKVKDENKKWVYTSMTLVTASMLVVGFSRLSAWYNLFVFPILFVAYTLLVIKTLPYFIRRHAQSDDSIFGLSREESAFYFRFETASGPLVIHKPQQNVYIDGGPGSGKSESWIKGIIYQCAERNYAGFVYDWEGDPTKDKSPILSRIAYGSIEHFRNKGMETPRFAYINFVDMSRTVRVNVLSPQYMSKGNESLFIRNIIMTLMKNLEASWKEKTDFWANNAINYVYSIAYKCFKERKLGICTLPHVIALALSDSNLVFHWLSEDPEIALNMSSMLTAWKLGAQQQTAGAVSSAQTPLVLLNNKYIFWVLSPLPEEEFSLDITNKEHPTLFAQLCARSAAQVSRSTVPVWCRPARACAAFTATVSAGPKDALSHTKPSPQQRFARLLIHCSICITSGPTLPSFMARPGYAISRAASRSGLGIPVANCRLSASTAVQVSASAMPVSGRPSSAWALRVAAAVSPV